MKYVYDIVLNFDEDALSSFEWNCNDDIEYIKKIPLLKVSEDDFSKIRSSEIIVESNMIKILRNQTEVYGDKKILLIPYACLLSCSKDVIAVEFNEKGQLISKSRLIIDEEDEVLELSASMPFMHIKYEIKSTEDEIIFLTRREKEKIFLLINEINDLYNNKNDHKLKYLYYERFNVLESDINKIYEKFLDFIDSDWDSKHNYLYDLIRLSYSKK